MKRLTLITGISCLFFLGTLIAVTRMESAAALRSHRVLLTAQPSVAWARAQGEFLAMDSAFRAIVNTPVKAWSTDAKRINRIMATFEQKRSAFLQRLTEVRGGLQGPQETKVLTRLDADLGAYRAITDAPDEATNAKLTPVVNAVNEDFDALESISESSGKLERTGPRIGGPEVSWIAAAGLGLSATLLAALAGLLLRYRSAKKAGEADSSASSYFSAGSLDIINRLSAATSSFGVVEPARSPAPEPEREQELKQELKHESALEAKPELEPEHEHEHEHEPELESAAALEPISEEPERPQIDATINDFTQHTQQLISALFSLNAVADSTMSLVGTLADALERSPDRREIEIVATELQTLTAAMLTTVQQLSSSTIRMQSQVIHMMKILEHT